MGKPIMVVSINYRVAALGFMSSIELGKEGNLNLGLYDQRLGLHWVQENIASFGGDPSSVTIWGESAGAMSVSNHLLAYAEQETSLFHAAILESGTSLTSAFPKIETAYQPLFDKVVNETGCGQATEALACLRGLSLEAFNASASAFWWDLVIDGDLISTFPSSVLTTGDYVKVPLLIGGEFSRPSQARCAALTRFVNAANTDEGAVIAPKHMNTSADLKAAIRRSYPLLTNTSIETMLDLYPNDPRIGSPYGTGDNILKSGPLDKVSNSIYGYAFFPGNEPASSKSR